MNLKEAQSKLFTSINADAEAVIASAQLFNPSIRDEIVDVRKAPGTIQGVASIAVRSALRGKDKSETEANIIKFASALS